jgi:hypothetical protein
MRWCADGSSTDYNVPTVALAKYLNDKRNKNDIRDMLLNEVVR